MQIFVNVLEKLPVGITDNCSSHGEMKSSTVV